MYLGIDLGGINVAAALVSDTGTIKKQRSTPTPRTPEGVADVIAEHVRQLLGDRNETVEYIGLGSPGVIDTEHGVVEYWSNLDFHDVPLADLIEARTGLPVLMENDAGCAALGEYIAGAGKGSTSMVVITLGTGIGGGAVLGGKLYTGLNHAGLEVGHFVLEHNGRPCTCGRKGCFETYCSATALIREMRKAMEQAPESLLWSLAGSPEKVNGKLIFEAYQQQDPAACRVVEEFLSYLGDGVVSLVNIFQPEVFCIGGGIAGAGELILGPVRKILDAEDYARGNPLRTRLMKARLGNDAGLIGAAMLRDFRHG